MNESPPDEQHRNAPHNGWPCRQPASNPQGDEAIRTSARAITRQYEGKILTLDLCQPTG